MWRCLRWIVSHAVYSAFIASCGSGDLSFLPDRDTGTLNLAVTDAPADSASRVVLEFAGVEVTAANGEVIRFDFAEPRSIDVLPLAGGGSAAILQNEPLPVGRYVRIRLLMNTRPEVQDDSFIELVSGGRFPLVIPAAGQPALALERAFSLERAQRVDFVVDFDLRKSLIAPAAPDSNFVFMPALRLVDASSAGALAGTVSPSLVSPACTPFVYVFSGMGVAPDDMDIANGVEPLVSVPATLDNTSGDYRYRAAFLEAGGYTVSFTCNGAADQPQTNEFLGFSGTVNATISAGQTTTVNFSF